ncbi:MAG: hypothetical protein ACFFE4_07235 [Candidatus Thorarchaeota archaeon]
MIEFFRENKKFFIITVLSLSLIIAIVLPLYFFLPSEPLHRLISNPPQNSPLSGYNENNYEEYDVIPKYNSIICKLRYGENLTFINITQGGYTSYKIYTYNQFGLESEDYYLRILYQISVTSLLRTELYIIQNGTWIPYSTFFKWQNPREYLIFCPLYHPLSDYSFSSVFDDLIINHTLIEENHEWLDLGYWEIGQLKSIQGYGFILIDVAITSAKNAYFGIEEISNQIKSIHYVEKFIFRVETIWQRYENHFFGWKTLMNKVYFLGNAMSETNHGSDGSSTINLMIYTF